MVPLMSITRNFFMGRELVRGWGPFSRFDIARADAIVVKELAQIGIDLRDPAQAVGTLSGGERQCVAIARAVYFGARVLILDEPTSALGVHQAAIVLKYVAQARQRGLGVVFISHNIHHAYAVADRFTLLNRGASKGTFRRADITRDEVLQAMAGGEDMQRIQAEIQLGIGARQWCGRWLRRRLAAARLPAHRRGRRAGAKPRARQRLLVQIRRFPARR